MLTDMILPMETIKKKFRTGKRLAIETIVVRTAAVVINTIFWYYD